MSQLDLNDPFAAKSMRALMWRSRGVFRGYLFWRLLSVLAVTPFPVITQQIIDKGLEANDLVLCLQLAGISVTLLTFHIFTMTKCVGILAKKSQAIITSMRGRIFAKLQFMNFGFLDRTQTGRLLSKYAFDTQNVEAVLIPMVASVIPELVRSSLLILALAILNPWLILFVLLAMPPVFAARIFFMGRLEAINESVRKARERLTGQASEFISAIRLVRGFGQERPVEQNMGDISWDYGEQRRNQMVINQTFGWSMFSMFAAIEIMAIAFGSVLVVHDQLTLGTLVALVGSLPVILGPANLLTSFSMIYMQGQESYRSIKELMDSGYVENWQGNRLPEPLQAKITLKDVSFRYDESENVAVQGLNLEIPAGAHVAFVGASGSGKSTLVNLILGLYQPSSGEILIDDIPQSALDVRSFRKRCAIVMQDNLLISGTIEDNLRFARPEASDEEVVEATKLANAWDFISYLPQGMDTKVGERGVALSGGQRQRIAIARAVLRDPVLLILDEATSALDNESEKVVQQAMERVAQNRTTITIAHRLSTVRKADLIVVMGEGRILETGAYQELANRPGSAFGELLAAQQG
ncbi:MAG: ABC transporter ATP-binding protein [Verrucomicrobiota bacterium]